MENLEEEVNEYLMEISKKVIEDVSEKALECLQKHIIDDVYTYDYYPNKIYTTQHARNGNGTSTFEFYDAFKLSGIERKMNSYIRDILYDYDSMGLYVDYDEDGENAWGVHQTLEGEDLREKLFDLLNVKGKFGHKERNEFWNNFMSELDNNIVRWAKEALNKYGIDAEPTLIKEED